MSDISKLPKPQRGARCEALDQHGRRCPREAVVQENYHGDNEIYDYFSGRPVWVRVAFCEKHADFRAGGEK